MEARTYVLVDTYGTSTMRHASNNLGKYSACTYVRKYVLKHGILKLGDTIKFLYSFLNIRASVRT